MGKVLVTLNVMPEGVETDLNKIADKLMNIGMGRFNSLERTPIAFGLVALRPSYIVDDAGGVSDQLEKRIKSIDGVKTAEVVEATLI